MVRIRYSKHDNELTNKNPIFLSSGVEIGVKIDTKLVQTVITDFSTRTILTVLTARNLSTLKVKTKNYLRELGVVFGDEIRNRGNTEILGAIEPNVTNV